MVGAIRIVIESGCLITDRTPDTDSHRYTSISRKFDLDNPFFWTTILATVINLGLYIINKRTFKLLQYIE